MLYFLHCWISNFYSNTQYLIKICYTDIFMKRSGRSILINWTTLVFQIISGNKADFNFHLVICKHWTISDHNLCPTIDFIYIIVLYFPPLLGILLILIFTSTVGLKLLVRVQWNLSARGRKAQCFIMCTFII